MKRWLLISLSINLVLVGIGLFALRRLGGWRFVVHRWQHSEPALYQHRRQLFEQLPDQPGAIIFLGDSQTALCEWRELFGNRLPILNRGIVGDHVDGVYQRLAEVLRHGPAKIFLQVGINDLLFGKNTADMELRYREISREIRTESPQTQLVLESILPVNNQWKNLGIRNAQIQEMNTRLARIAQDENRPFVDIYGPLTNPGGDLNAQFTEDGLHLNAAGYAVWKQQIAHFLNN